MPKIKGWENIKENRVWRTNNGNYQVTVNESFGSYEVTITNLKLNRQLSDEEFEQRVAEVSFNLRPAGNDKFRTEERARRSAIRFMKKVPNPGKHSLLYYQDRQEHYIAHRKR